MKKNLQTEALQILLDLENGNLKPNSFAGPLSDLVENLRADFPDESVKIWREGCKLENDLNSIIGEYATELLTKLKYDPRKYIQQID